jgi:uncharacterized protein (DUF1015 family)
LAKIVPFRGILYNNSKAGNMSDLVTPPYDVIGEREQREYYKKSQYNVIRLEYGDTRKTDDSHDNRYTRAAAFFAKWLAEDILVREKSQSVYLYEQEFEASGHRLTRSGIICGVGVEDYKTGTVLPHEETLAKAKADRLDLLRHCRANFSPIFGLYDDPCLTVENLASSYTKSDPLLSFRDDNGETHRLWRIDKAADLNTIIREFSEKKVYIADGHHRYETALAFHREMLLAGNSNYNFVLMTLVNLYDPGLVILPAHRLVKNIPDFATADLLASLAENFTVTPVELPATGRETAAAAKLQAAQDSSDGCHIFCLYAAGMLYRLSLPRTAARELMAKKAPEMSLAWRSLDVAVLQCLVLEDRLGIYQEARHSGSNLVYTHSVSQALDEVDSAACQAAFMLSATRVPEVLDVASAGDKMPQKSTYFYPKLITGLVINDFSIGR